MDTEVKAKRPLFLTILCILSFLGIALALVSEVATWFTIKNQFAMLQMAEESLREAPRHELVMRQWSVIIGALTLPVCFIGVLFMWRLKKAGFYIYTVTELAMPVIGAICLGFSGPAYQTATIIMGAIVSIAFVIMYGFNLKHMG